MLKPIVHWLIVVTLFANQCVFAGNCGSRPATSPSVTATDEQPTSWRCYGNVRKVLKAVGGFYYNHSDFINRTAILACDIVYFLGTFFPGPILTPAANTSFMLLSYVGLIGVPFAGREIYKALGDTRYACKRGCKEVVCIGAIRTCNSTYSLLIIPTYSVAATLLEFESTRDSGMAIYNNSVLRVASPIFLVIGVSLDVYNFLRCRGVIPKLDSPGCIRNQVNLLRGAEIENISGSEEARLSAIVRSQMDLVNWAKFEKMIGPSERVPLLSGMSVPLGNERELESLGKFIMDGLKLQRNYAVGDLALNILFRIEIGVMRAVGPGKIMASMDLGSAVLSDTVLGVKKCMLARQRTALDQATNVGAIVPRDPEMGYGTFSGRRQPGHGSVDIVATVVVVPEHTLSIGDGSLRDGQLRMEDVTPDCIIEVIPAHESVRNEYVFMLVENLTVPLAVRIAAARGCNPMDSYHIATDGRLDVRIRAAVLQNCETGVREMLMNDSEIRRGLGLLREKELETSMVPHDIDRVEGRQPLLLDSSHSHDRLESLSREDLFRIASDPDESLIVRCGAAYLLGHV